MERASLERGTYFYSAKGRCYGMVVSEERAVMVTHGRIGNGFAPEAGVIPSDALPVPPTAINPFTVKLALDVASLTRSELLKDMSSPAP